ncbi:hypothetical protein PHLCEN_2v10711 [Hermanssonia centrifuga]|uniref:Uncharacterized protein n=1 Tax=Hermanssonia centrifuga TaxID=98765 RepID=A0A2R6NM51_9APHY|nr:hypothetical protein PHLCEN_2v10711 [Hermanssonia centrifuga]
MFTRTPGFPAERRALARIRRCSSCMTFNFKKGPSQFLAQTLTTKASKVRARIWPYLCQSIHTEKHVQGFDTALSFDLSLSESVSSLSPRFSLTSHLQCPGPEGITFPGETYMEKSSFLPRPRASAGRVRKEWTHLPVCVRVGLTTPQVLLVLSTTEFVWKPACI